MIDNFVQMLVVVWGAEYLASKPRKAFMTEIIFISVIIPRSSFKLMYKVNEVTITICLSQELLCKTKELFS